MQIIRKLLVIMVTLLAAGIFTGCAGDNTAPPVSDQVSETVRLYYGDSGNEKLVTEERQVTYRKGEDKYRAVLEELLKGPTGKGHRANISPEAKVLGTTKQDSDLIVNFSRGFNSFGGEVGEIVAVGSVVNTMTQFPEIKRVKILIEGKEYMSLSGQPRGFMETFTSPGEAAHAARTSAGDIDTSRLPEKDVLENRFSVTNAESRLNQVDQALGSFRAITEKSRGKLTAEELQKIGNTSWEVQSLGFQNWVGSVRGTLKNQDYRIKKLEYELAQRMFQSGEIKKEDLDRKEAEYNKAKAGLQTFINSFHIAD